MWIGLNWQLEKDSIFELVRCLPGITSRRVFQSECRRTLPVSNTGPPPLPSTMVLGSRRVRQCHRHPVFRQGHPQLDRAAECSGVRPGLRTAPPLHGNGRLPVPRAVPPPLRAADPPEPQCPFPFGQQRQRHGGQLRRRRRQQPGVSVRHRGFPGQLPAAHRALLPAPALLPEPGRRPERAAPHVAQGLRVRHAAGPQRTERHARHPIALPGGGSSGQRSVKLGVVSSLGDCG